MHARNSTFNSSQLEYTCRCTGGYGTGVDLSDWVRICVSAISEPDPRTRARVWFRDYVSPSTVTVCLPVWLVSLAREQLCLVSGEGEAMKYPASTGTVQPFQPPS